MIVGAIIGALAALGVAACLVVIGVGIAAAVADRVLRKDIWGDHHSWPDSPAPRVAAPGIDPADSRPQERTGSDG